MDIRHLKTLIAIADYGTFGAAGEAVFLSQSAVSQQVRIIEEFLGVKIFDRTVRPPALTAQGVMVLEGARKIVKEYDRITRKMSGDGLSGRLVIGAIRASIKGALPKALAILRHRYPRLRIQLHTGSSSDLIAKVEHGSLDAAIAPMDTKLNETLNWLPYTSEPLMVIADMDTKGNTDIGLLENSPYIKYFNHSSVALMIDTEIQRRNMQVHAEIYSDALDTIIRIVEHGLGVSVLPEPRGGESFPANIRKIPFGDPPLKRQLGIIYQKLSDKEKIVRALHDELFKLSGSPDLRND